MEKLNETQLHDTLESLPQWKLDGGRLLREWEFPDFSQAMVFVNGIAVAAEASGHHPDIDIRYNRVLLGLVSHDAGGITNRDVHMARQINDQFDRP